MSAMQIKIHDQSIRPIRFLAGLFFCTCFGVTMLYSQGAIVGLGGLQADQVSSIAMAISDDGETVVGASLSDEGFQAFRHHDGTMQALGYIDGETGDSTALGVSADGSIVVGSSGPSSSRQQAFVWSEAAGMRGLGYLDGGRDISKAYAVSSDGLTIVGSAYSEKGIEAIVTTTGEPLAPLHPFRNTSYTNSSALALSADGSIAAGFGNPVDGVLVQNAFTWTTGSSTDLGTLPGVSGYSIANALSPDGQYAAGWSASPEGVQATLWSPGLPPLGLGYLPGGVFYSVARDVSADGSIVVGISYSDNGPEAMIWTGETGMVRMVDFLEAAGVDIGSWILVDTCGISSEGSAIAGTGLNPEGDMEAWMIRLSSDADGDGVPDDQDRFQFSDTRPTILIAGLDTGIVNQVLSDGATLADLIAELEAQSKNKGHFTSEVAILTRTWVESGIISGREKGRLQSAAAKVKQ